MEHMVRNLRTAAERRAAYHRTVREIQAMPKSVAEDLGIFREDARELARRAVYG